MEQVTGNSIHHLWVGKTCISYVRNPLKKGVDFEGKVFIFQWAFILPLLSNLTGYCNTFWCYSSTDPKKNNKINSSSFLAKRYAANNCCIVGSPTDVSWGWEWSSDAEIQFKFQLLTWTHWTCNVLCSVEESLQYRHWATYFFQINEVTCNDLLAYILDLWRNHLTIWKQFNCKDLSYNVQS